MSLVAKSDIEPEEAVNMIIKLLKIIFNFEKNINK